MRLLVFQHIACEHPGALRTYLKEDGVEWDAVQLDEGDQIPPLENYDVLWVMGGPMDVWDVKDNPWLIDEKHAIRKWVSELRKPYLGLCLGHQLLADCLGGTCGPCRNPEIGIMEIELTEDGKADPVFGSLPTTQTCLQWHSVEVAQAPEGAVILAKSDKCDNQAMRVGKNAWSAQYHVEVENDTVANWGAIPAYASALEKTLGPSGLSDMKRDAAKHSTTFENASRAFYNNFMKQARS